MNRPSWSAFTAAPHRVMFFTGAVQLVAALAYWSLELGGRAFGAPLPTVIPATWTHAWLMLYGIFPAFIFGFLMTVYPRWMNGVALTPKRYLPAFAGFAAGHALAWLGLFTGRGVLAAGLALVLAGWAWGWWWLVQVFLHTPDGDKRHERVLNVALAAGWLGLAAFLVWVLSDAAPALRLALVAGPWFLLLPVFFTVVHRMVPFFSSVVIPGYTMVRPTWTLVAVNAGFCAHGLLELSGAPAGLVVVDLPLAAIVLWQWWAWQPQRALRVPLLAVLHIAAAWLPAGLLLYAVQALGFASGHYWLGRAPLHALGIGFMLALLLGMASRVTLGHSGQPLAASRLMLACFAGLNGVALLRIAGEYAPALSTLAALGGFACVLAWAWRHAPIYLLPRSDGKPG